MKGSDAHQKIACNFRAVKVSTFKDPENLLVFLALKTSGFFGNIDD